MHGCDPATGRCTLPDTDASFVPPARPTRRGSVHYIGDPMCSWCWGISPAVRELAAFCHAEGIDFTLTMGGLRPGGGDPWNEEFKAFLRKEWRHIAEVTGQPFGFSLLDAPRFTYDTEPACRAVTSLQLLLEDTTRASAASLAFFVEVQRKFYVEGEDPKLAGFYAQPCAQAGVEFERFRDLFDSDQAKQATREAFARCRQWGVRAFPTLLYEQDERRVPLASGFATAVQLISNLRQRLAA